MRGNGEPSPVAARPHVGVTARAGASEPRRRRLRGACGQVHPLFAAVGQGSDQEPALIALRYEGPGAAGPKLGPFLLRSEALDAERIWLESNWLNAPSTPLPCPQ